MPKFKVGDHVIINKNVSGTIVFINLYFKYLVKLSIVLLILYLKIN